ncbi:MAG: hypothetical protein M3Q10_05545 [Chloroflexota bacterium]|nr:hypothetical protein [Chloroflexota bacterium]
MPALDPGLRKDLERTTVAARLASEEGARAALDVLAVRLGDAPASMQPDGRALRTALRARAKVLGEGDRERGCGLLAEEIAYETWHRLYFSRTLAENELLRHPEYGVPVTLEECAQLARDEGATDAWDLAARYAAQMLPRLFREDDPSARVPLAREHRARLEPWSLG